MKQVDMEEQMLQLNVGNWMPNNFAPADNAPEQQGAATPIVMKYQHSRRTMNKE